MPVDLWVFAAGRLLDGLFWDGGVVAWLMPERASTDAPEARLPAYASDHGANQRRRINAFGAINRSALKELGAEIVNRKY